MSTYTKSKEVKEKYESVVYDLLGRYSAREIALFSADEGTERFNRNRLGQKPERYVEEMIVWPLLRSLGYSYRTEVYCQTQNVYADLELELSNSEVIYGEVKTFGCLDEARWDIVGCLGDGIFSNSVGFATDGIKWWMFDQDVEMKIRPPDKIAEFDFRAFILNVLKEVEEATIDLRKHRVSTRSLKTLDRQKEAKKFVEKFNPSIIC